MATYGSGKYKAIVLWKNGKEDTHRFESEKSRDRFISFTRGQQKESISKITTGMTLDM